MRAKSLTSQIEIQKLKVAALAEEHKRLAEANGENSRTAQDAEIELNQETERLNKMGAELNTTTGALDEMKAGSDQAGEAAEKLSEKLGLDTTDFSTGLQAANSTLRVLESGFKASSAALGDWASSATGLEMRAKSLTSQIEIQKLKVAALAEEHKRLAEANGENSRAAQDAEIELNQETERLSKMGAELNTTTGALDEMKAGSDQAGDSVEELGNNAATSEKKLFTFKDVLHGIGAAGKAAMIGIVALGTAAVATAGLLAGMALNTADYGSTLADMSAKTSISTTRLQEMRYAGNILGVELETVTGAQAKLIRSMAESQDQSQSYADKLAEATKAGKDLGSVELGDKAKGFESLGISVTDSTGKLRDSQTVFAETIDALGKIENPAERDALAMSIFGKSAQELNPLIKAGSDELARLSDEAHKMGAVMSEEDVAAADAFGDKLDGLKMGFQGIMAQIGLAFIPGLSGLTDTAKGYLQDLLSVVQGSGGDVGKMAEGMGALFGKIVTDLSKQAPQMLQTGLTLVKSVLSSIISALPVLLPAAISIIKSLVDFIIQNLPMVLDAAISILMMLVDALVQNTPMLVTAALTAIVTLANGLSAAAPTLIPSIVEAMVLIVKTLIDNLPLLITAALTLIVALAQGITAALPQLMELIGPEMSVQIIGAILSMIPAILMAGAQIIIALAQGLISLIPERTLAIGSQFIENLLFQGIMWSIKATQMGADLLDNLVKGLKDIGSKAVEIGKNFINGIIKGIQSAASSLYDAVSDIVNNMLDTVTGSDGLDQQSPSKKGRAIGANFTNSLAVGGQDALRTVIQSYIGMTGQLAAATAAGMSGSAGGAVSTSSVSSEYNAYYAPVTIVSSKQVSAAEDAAKGRRF
jgi:hypothetical protein